MLTREEIEEWQWVPENAGPVEPPWAQAQQASAMLGASLDREPAPSREPQSAGSTRSPSRATDFVFTLIWPPIPILRHVVAVIRAWGVDVSSEVHAMSEVQASAGNQEHGI
jgi:hypothetical protein